MILATIKARQAWLQDSFYQVLSALQARWVGVLLLPGLASWLSF